MARYAGTATKVITYQYAYRAHGDGNDARISLCREHANNESAGRPLGAVSHTWHRGRCAVCAQINAATKAGYTRRQAETIIERERPWCACGDITAERCQWDPATRPSMIVTVIGVSPQHRGTAKTLGSWDGLSSTYVLEASCAEAIIQAEPDWYEARS